MKMKQIIAGLLIAGTLSINLSYADIVYTQPTAAMPTTYYNEYYDNGAYYNQVPTATVQVVERKETFAQKHPILTTLGIGALFAGAVTAGVAISHNHHHHYYAPPRPAPRPPIAHRPPIYPHRRG